MTNKRSLQKGLTVVGLIAAPAVQAHPQLFHASGFVHGLLHPWTGADHWLAMIAVGLWAAQLGGAACWRVPLSFMACMAAGAALAISGISLPYVEAGIAASVLVLGLAIVSGLRVGPTVGMALVGVFALFHGHAHGSEIAANLPALEYGLGFLASTAMLLGIGIASGILLRRTLPDGILRLTGAIVLGGGAWLIATL